MGFSFQAQDFFAELTRIHQLSLSLQNESYFARTYGPSGYFLESLLNFLQSELFKPWSKVSALAYKTGYQLTQRHLELEIGDNTLIKNVVKGDDYHCLNLPSAFDSLETSPYILQPPFLLASPGDYLFTRLSQLIPTLFCLEYAAAYCSLFDTPAQMETALNRHRHQREIETLHFLHQLSPEDDGNVLDVAETIENRLLTLL